jgi:uncharacterized protein YdeI (YjbR/CyaY-like superfamily)
MGIYIILNKNKFSMNTAADNYFDNVTNWKTELRLLRSIVQESNLIEDFKWRMPCYTYQNKNIIMVGKFKDYCVISFLKGVLLKDEKQLLVSPGENSQSVKFLKFTDISTIKKLSKTITQYIYEAIEIEESGLKIEKKQSTAFDLPIELLQAFKTNKALQIAFEKLTTGRRRAYCMHIDGAKHSDTKFARIAKYTQRILDGYGMMDCTCGLSKRMPNCDGSHKMLQPLAK